jgi:hypothetical protein
MFLQVNAEIAKDFEKCPFTGAHIIRKSELLNHIKTCSAKAVLDSLDSKSNLFIFCLNFILKF